MKTLALLSLLWLSVADLGAQGSIAGGVDLASSGSQLSSPGWALDTDPVRTRTFKGTHSIYDVATFANVGWMTFSVDCNSNPLGDVTCQYRQVLIARGSAGRCYRAALAARMVDATGAVKLSNSFGSAMVCLPPAGDPTCVGGGPIPTFAETPDGGPLAPREPNRLDPQDLTPEIDGEPATEPGPPRDPVTFQGAKDCGNSPILIDLENEGFPLSDDPVLFDLDADGKPERTNWTSARSGVAFLVLDRDGNGSIDSGLELFGNNTRLFTGEKAQYGYIALAEYDLEAFGGNFDGFIGPEDAIWPKLRLWVDRDHDGISRPGELLTLDQVGILKLEYDYQISRRQDRYGDRFLAKGKAWRENRHGKPREVPLWDVWFVRR
jgi:hypothetical protein